MEETSRRRLATGVASYGASRCGLSVSSDLHRLAAHRRLRRSRGHQAAARCGVHEGIMPAIEVDRRSFGATAPLSV